MCIHFVWHVWRRISLLCVDNAHDIFAISFHYNHYIIYIYWLFRVGMPDMFAKEIQASSGQNVYVQCEATVNNPIFASRFRTHESLEHLVLMERCLERRLGPGWRTFVQELDISWPCLLFLGVDGCWKWMNMESSQAFLWIRGSLNHGSESTAQKTQSLLLRKRSRAEEAHGGLPTFRSCRS